MALLCLAVILLGLEHFRIWLCIRISVSVHLYIDLSAWDQHP